MTTEWTRSGTECFLAPGRPGGGRAPRGRKSTRGSPVRHPDRTQHAGTRWV